MPIQLLNTNNTGTFTLVNKSNGGSMSFEVYAPPSPTPSVSVTPSITISVTPSITPSVSVTPSVSITPSVTITPSISTTPSVTVTPSITPSLTITPSITPTNTPSISITPSPTPFINNQIWQYDPTTTMSSPAIGNLRFNSGTTSAITQIAINNSGVSSASLTAASGKTLVLTVPNGSVFINFLLNQNSVNNTTWQLYTGTVTSNGGSYGPGQFLNLRIV